MPLSQLDPKPALIVIDLQKGILGLPTAHPSHEITGKSADLAGAFGGQGSQTAFGPRGAANLLTKLTTYSAILFMLTSIGLTVLLARSGGDHSVLSGTAHPTSQTTPAKK